MTTVITPIYSYLFKNGTLVDTHAGPACKEGYTMFDGGKPISWLENTYDEVTNTYVPIVKPPIYVPTPQTPSQIKQQKIDDLAREYPPKLANLLEAKGKAEMNGVPTTAIVTKWQSLNAEWKARIKEILAS